MKKDIEWLKSAIQQNLDFYNDNDEEWQMAKVRAYAKSLDLINQLDEPEVLSQELPVIPKFVADWIEASRHATYHLLGAVYDGAYSEDMKEWLFKGDKRTRQDNQDKLARAWLDGFTVEEEQKYIVLSKDKRTILLTRWADEATPCAEPITEKEERDQLTEQEIKDYDERYFAFAVKVEEEEQ